jgi:hypothetical protein
MKRVKPGYKRKTSIKATNIQTASLIAKMQHATTGIVTAHHHRPSHIAATRLTNLDGVPRNGCVV